MAIRARRKRASTDEIAAAVLQGSLVDLLPLLRCPRTGNELKPTEDGSLVARGAEWRYPVFRGAPVLIDLEHCLFDVTAPPRDHDAPSGSDSPPAGLGGRAARMLRRLSTSERGVVARRNRRRVVELLRVRAASGRQPRILVVGGQREDATMDEVLACAEVQVVATGVAPGPGTDVVCDPHSLPFADRAFDAVIIQSVLDCVAEPRRVAAEVHRVLGEDGLVYSEAGFMRQVHAGAFDFNRFTHLGHRRLWRFFDEVDSGAQSGPAIALLWSTESFARTLAGSSRMLRAIAARAVGAAGFWLKYVDLLLVRRAGGIDAAAGTFFLGTRRDAPVPDRELMAAFRGIRFEEQQSPTVRGSVPEPADEEIRVSRGLRISRGKSTPSGV